MKPNLKFLRATLLVFTMLVVTSAFSQVATTDLTLNDTLYIVKLTKNEGLYILTYTVEGREKLSKISVNFTQLYVFSHLKELWCMNNNLKLSNFKPISSEKAELENKANKCFIDLLFTFSNVEDVKGQKIANVKLANDIPVYADIRLKKFCIEDFISKKEYKEAKENSKITNSVIKLYRKEFPIIKEGKFNRDFKESKETKETTEVSFKYQGKDIKYDDSSVAFYTNYRFLGKDILMASIKDSFKPENCQIVFENGFIATIIVSGTFNGKSVRFSNRYSIGVTTRKNIYDFKQIHLKDELNSTDAYVKLSEVIEYARIPDVYTRDYSPKDIKINLSEIETSMPVYKSPSPKLFRLNIFSDFVGMNEENPNGLVQLEVDKRINLWTKRVAKVSVCTFLTPYFEWSKIEQHNRSLKFSEVNDTNYVSPLQVYRYSMIQSGVLWNLIEGDGSVVKGQFNLAPALTFTQLKDSTINTKGEVTYVDKRINSIILGLDFKLIFSPEKSWNMAIGTRPFYNWNLNSSIQYNSLQENLNEQKRVNPIKWLNELSLLITYRSGMDNDNLFFARMNFIHELENFSSNFAQLQLGYSIYLKTVKK